MKKKRHTSINNVDLNFPKQANNNSVVSYPQESDTTTFWSQLYQEFEMNHLNEHPFTGANHLMGEEAILQSTGRAITIGNNANNIHESNFNLPPYFFLFF
ncbi:hypothetical protein AgCh_024931 [Apium graveolens]